MVMQDIFQKFTICLQFKGDHSSIWRFSGVSFDKITVYGFPARDLDQDGVFTDALDPVPRNAKLLTLPPIPNTSMFNQQQRGDPTFIQIKFKILRKAETHAVTQIDDLLFAQLRGTAALHSISPFPYNYMLWKV